MLMLFTVCSLRAPAQTTVLRFLPMMNGQALQLYDGTSADSLRVTMLRCYISGISLWQDGQRVWGEENSYHLLDAEHPESLALALKTPPGLHYNKLRFSLGIDSATSCSGAQGGDLDPAKGMYWAWQSGYINLKIEGLSPLSGARRHQFQFHLGGYAAPYAAIQEVMLGVQPAREIPVRMETGTFLQGLDLAKQSSMMIPGRAAFELSRKAAAIFQTR